MAAEAQKNRPSSESRPRLSGHDALRYAREAVDDAITAPSGDHAHWAAGLRTGLEGLVTILHRHREVSEAPGGTLEEMAQLRPRLTPRIDRSRAEHLPLIARGEGLRDAVDRQIEAGNIDVAVLRADAGALQDDVRHHMAKGVDLINEVYFQDMGGEG